MIRKLVHYPHMKLSQMQDIGGCRAVVDTVTNVTAMQDAYRQARIRHVLVNSKDYIMNPKTSGYRSVHLVYRYRSDRKTVYNGRLIEVQLRTKLQHAWATAVETASTFLQQDLKSSHGNIQWLGFFALVSSVFAQEEDCPGIPGVPKDVNRLRSDVRALAKELNVVQTLVANCEVIRRIDIPQEQGWHFILLERRLDQNRVIARGYRRGQIATAARDYRRAENNARNIDGADAVLVSVDSIQSLKRAYPNYYLDTNIFVRELERVMET